MKRSAPCFKCSDAFSLISSAGGKLQRSQGRRAYWKRKGGRHVFSFGQRFTSFLDSLYALHLSLSLSLSLSVSLSLILNANSFLVVSLSVCLFLHHPLLPLVNMHYGLQTQWQFSPSAIWDQYWVSSTTSWPDILISVIQTKYCALCPPTRQPTVYSPSEWLKLNAKRKHTFMGDYL